MQLNHTHVTHHFRNIYPLVALSILLICISCAPFGGTPQSTSIPTMPPAHAGLVYALAASNGRILWHYALSGYPTLVSLTGDLLYVQGVTYQQSNAGTQTVQSSLYALRIDKGTPLWIKATGKAQPVSKPRSS